LTAASAGLQQRNLLAAHAAAPRDSLGVRTRDAALPQIRSQTSSQM
jgi:hypothetical protein